MKQKTLRKVKHAKTYVQQLQLFMIFLELRRNVSDILTLPYHNEQFLLRWLRARNFDVDAAEKMLRESMKWRKEWDADCEHLYEPPEVFSQFYPSGVSGFDKDGAPVIVLPFAGLDMWGFMHSVSKHDFMKVTIRKLEEYLALARKQVEVHGPAAGQLVAVIDMTDFNLRQYAWRPAGEVVLSLVQMYEANYPEILKACFIINAPKVFALAFSVVKTFLNEYTINKIHIYKADPTKWQPVILKQIPKDQLPAIFGGTMTDPDGNPRCPSKIPQGGKIPKSYYMRKKMEKLAAETKETYTTITVKKGDKLTLDYLAAEEGSFLKWGFYSDSHDIKFGVVCKNEDGNETVVVPVHRVASHQAEEVGIITCPAPATYTLIFDNTYSYLRSKRLHYSINVSPPLPSPTDSSIIASDEISLEE
ncbi:SEC14-like protein 2 isoform X1 [Nilaparvata lugens]|uniref:SEC14-like protein 2 isoform X1 n=1 Tax=Nilaparvata lugens TaxID=108931 RepID=UPI000B995343|nr:SEC14-like protein 2 isoform X1 [Nilaparvata lugens]